MENIIKKISIRGRLYFCLQCLQNAFNESNIKGKERDLILKTIINFLQNDEFDKWEKAVDNILPLNILDDKFNINDFEIEHSLVFKLKLFYEHLPSYLVDLIDSTFSVGLNNLYGSTEKYSPLTLDSTLQVIAICRQNNVKMPDIADFLKFSFDEEHGWGSPIKIQEAFDN